MASSVLGQGVRRTRRIAFVLGLATIVAILAPSRAQEITDDMVGQNQRAWGIWSEAMRALDRDKKADAQQGLEQVAKMNLSPLRLALMADRTGTLRLEQGVASNELGEAAKALLEQITVGRRQRRLAEDGWHFAAIGRFNYADANFKALIDSAPDPVALLEFSRYNPVRTTTLIKLVANAEVGPSAQLVLKKLQEGEQKLRTDPYEINVNIERLGGPPRVVYHASNNLKASGEYAVPHLIAALRDPKQRDLHPAIVGLLPMLGRAGLNPMVVALEMKDPVTKLVLVRALGEIGYAQALPYLARLARSGEHESNNVRTAAREAMRAIGATDRGDPAALFQKLAEDYYNNQESLRADERFTNANVWYFDEQKQNVDYIAVPRAIFNDVMAMRCAEASLKLRPVDVETTALWIAANIRREAKLGMDVESEAPSELAARDGTRPPDYPRSIYFARAAGPIYCHFALGRAVRDRDAGVALGAIAALASTAGPASLIGDADYQQALVESLAFPNRLVRIKAALALGRALPQTDFRGAPDVIHVLGEALSESGRQIALVVDPDGQTRNQMQAVLRGLGYEVIADAEYHRARQEATDKKVPGFDAIVIASDLKSPGLDAAVRGLRDHFVTSAVPILVIIKEKDIASTTRVTRSYVGVESIAADVFELGDAERIAKMIGDRISSAGRAMGAKPLDEKTAAAMAMEAAEVLRMIAVSRTNVYDVSKAEGALVRAMDLGNEALHVRAAAALALVGTGSSQTALARAAIETKRGESERIALFRCLAESARTFGSQLSDGLVQQIVAIAKDEENLAIRTACSQALGALNLTTNRASEIVRAQSRG